MTETLFGNPDLTRGSHRKHVSNLKINVQTAMGWKPQLQTQALQGRTVSLGFSPIYPPAVRTSTDTPDPTYTFGVPHQTTFSDSDLTSPASANTRHHSPHIRTTLQPYSVPSTFTNSHRTSVSSRVMSRSFSLTPTVAESDYQSISVSLPHTSRLRSNSSNSPAGVQPSVPSYLSNSPFRSSSNPISSSKHPQLPPLTAFLPHSHHNPIHDDTTTTTTKRQRRYTLVESSLSTSLSHLLPLQTLLHSPTHVRQREIDGLKKAMAALDARMTEERGLLESVKKVMKEDGNEVDFKQYRDRRNERWRIGKRLEALEGERKGMEDRLNVLSMNPLVFEPSQTHGQSQISRTDRNLQMFLSQWPSPTKTAFHGRQRNHYYRHHRHHHHHDHGMRPRRMTMNDVEPMRLRMLSIEETFVEAMNGFVKGVAALGIRPEDKRTERTSVLAEPILTSVVEDEGEGIVVYSSEPARELSSSTSSISNLDDPPSSPDTGTALIFRHHILPPEILMDDSEIEFEIPIYARDLFNRFEKERGEVDVGFSVSLASASSPNLSAPVSMSTPFKVLRRHLGKGPRHPSPSKQVGHGILMPRPSLVGLREEGVGSKSLSPKAQSRPVSTIDSLMPGGGSRVSFVGSNVDLGGVVPGSGSKRLRRKLSKRIFKKW